MGNIYFHQPVNKSRHVVLTLFQSNPIQSKGIKCKRLLGAIHIFWLFEKDLWRPVKLCYFASVGLIAFEEAIEQIEKNPATAALHSTRAFESCRRKHNLIAQRLVVFRHCANRNSQQGNHVQLHSSISFKLITAAPSRALFQWLSSALSDSPALPQSMAVAIFAVQPPSKFPRNARTILPVYPTSVRSTMRTSLPPKRDRSLVGCVLICFVSYRFFFFACTFCSSQRGRLQQMPPLFQST